MLKAKLLFLLISICFAVIIAKLFFIQIITPYNYRQNNIVTKRILPERGKVFDRNKDPLVVNQTMYQMYFEPKKMEDVFLSIKGINSILGLGEATLEAKIDKTKEWVAVTGGIDKKQKDDVEKMKLKGIGFIEESRRYYPEGSLSAHLLGFVGKSEKGGSVGYFGLEGFYDKDLTGLPGLIKSEEDLAGRAIFVGTQKKTDPENGRDLILTIDKSVQKIIKTRLEKGLERYEAKEGCIIVADPNTMEIFGLSCLPDFNPDEYYRFSEYFFRNFSVSDAYEPGSTFKPLIVAAALEERAIKPDEVFQEDGPITVGDYTIRTWNNKYEGEISMTRILEKSSNVGMVYIGEKLGDKKIYEYIKKLGFGELTGIDLQGEIAGYLRPRQQWYPIDYATVTFGQGIAVTPIQMVRAFSALINGGNLMKPFMVRSIASQEKERKISPKIEKTVFSKKTSEIIKKMLVSTIENGDARWARPKGYKIGGKTGTAQIPIKGHYDPTKTIASFIGFAPADNPRFIAMVILKEPQSSQWGSETAAPLFFEIAKDLLVYYNINPE